MVSKDQIKYPWLENFKIIYKFKMLHQFKYLMVETSIMCWKHCLRQKLALSSFPCSFSLFSLFIIATIINEYIYAILYGNLCFKNKIGPCLIREDVCGMTSWCNLRLLMRYHLFKWSQKFISKERKESLLVEQVAEEEWCTVCYLILAKTRNALKRNSPQERLQILGG